MSSGEFSVWQFFGDGTSEPDVRWVDAKTAGERAVALTRSVGARVGTTRRVIITDSGDQTCFEWQFEAGVTFPARGNVLVVRSDGKLRTYRVSRPPSLLRCQRMVGGYIEVVPHWDKLIVQDQCCPALALCNEDGKRNKTRNELATLMWWHALGRRVDDHLCGNVVVLYGNKQFLKRWSEGDDSDDDDDI